MCSGRPLSSACIYRLEEEAPEQLLQVVITPKPVSEQTPRQPLPRTHGSSLAIYFQPLPPGPLSYLYSGFLGTSATRSELSVSYMNPPISSPEVEGF